MYIILAKWICRMYLLFYKKMNKFCKKKLFLVARLGFLVTTFSYIENIFKSLKILES